MQFQADILGIPVVRPRYAETTALGAAYLAGLGVNFWSSQDEIAANWQSERRFLPQLDTAAAQARLVDWARAVERTRGWSRPAAPNV